MPGSSPPVAVDLAAVRLACDAAGLAMRGAFLCRPDDQVPDVGADAALSLVLLGAEGARGFDAFRDSPHWGQGTDPLDRFAEQAIGALAEALGARAVFPHRGPPWQPFQRWAGRAAPVARSPLGLLIHPTFGLWHAYRGALAFAHRLDGIVPAERVPAACLDCVHRPCLSTCPVSAFDTTGYDLDACVAHLGSTAGRTCVDAGCAARNACPVGTGFRYSGEQMRFHMHAFARARGVDVD